MLVCAVSHAATISGVVRGPDGTGFRAAFVKAQNTVTKTTVAVLSDDAGRYRIDNLQAGEYRLSAKTAGLRVDVASNVTLTSDGHPSIDVALQKDVIRWADLSIYQGKELFPEERGSDLLFDNCLSCHGFQNEMATATHTAEEWKKRVDYERTAHGSALGQLTDQDVDEISFYLGRLFGPNSELKKSPADVLGEDRHAGYLDTVRSFGSDSLNIVYVEYEVPPASRFPCSAVPDEMGNIWIPNGGLPNKIARLQPQLASLQDFVVSNRGVADIHSLVPAADGSIWLGEQSSDTLGRWDPGSQKAVEYPHAGKDGGSMHTLRVDAAGNIWSSGASLTKFDPKTGRFTDIGKMPAAYDVELDRQDNAWFTDPAANEIGRVDSKTLKVAKWQLPSSNAGPRRMQIAPDGTIWVAEFNVDKLAAFDPKTHSFKEYALPGPEASPSALMFDSYGYLWYSSDSTDAIARFDTRTGNTIRYPFPHSEISAKEFFRDDTGKIWFASSANDEVGYFFLSNSKE